MPGIVFGGQREHGLKLHRSIRLANPRRCKVQTVRDRDFNIELLFKALADPTRLRLIQLLGDEEVCVCSFVETLKTNQPKVSRHLAYLKRAGLVTTRRDGKWIHYRLVEPADPCAAKIVREVREWLANSAANSAIP